MNYGPQRPDPFADEDEQDEEDEEKEREDKTDSIPLEDRQLQGEDKHTEEPE